MLLGSGEETKGHTLYGIAQNKVIYIRDVEFNEKIKVPYCRPESPDVDYKVMVDFSSYMAMILLL